MARITVTTDTPAEQGEPAVLLDEHVQSVHLASGHAAAQLVERLAWAVIDAEQQDEGSRKPVPAHEQIPAHRARMGDRRRGALRSFKRVASLQSGAL